MPSRSSSVANYNGKRFLLALADDDLEQVEGLPVVSPAPRPHRLSRVDERWRRRDREGSSHTHGMRISTERSKVMMSTTGSSEAEIRMNGVEVEEVQAVHILLVGT